jgi:hypothetical protein
MGGFQEIQKNGESVYCFTGLQRKEWNSKIPGDTMWLDTNVGSLGSSASVGYRPEEW